MPGSMVEGAARALLRDRTAERHRRLEDRLAASHGFGSVEGYGRLLELSFGFYEPCEARLAALDWARVGLDFGARRKAHLLEADLRRLGRDPAVPARCTRLPSLPGLADGLGCLYVLEGATLGGRVILRHLAERFGEAGLPTTFYASYGAALGAMWRAFCTVLERELRSAEAREAAAVAAEQTFHCLETWLFRDGGLS